MFRTLCAMALLASVVGCDATGDVDQSDDPGNRGPLVITELRHDESPPLTDIPPTPPSGRTEEDINPIVRMPNFLQSIYADDPVTQEEMVSVDAPTAGKNI